MPYVSLIVFSFLLEMGEGIGTAMYRTGAYTLLSQLFPSKKGMISVSILSSVSVLQLYFFQIFAPHKVNTKCCDKADYMSLASGVADNGNCIILQGKLKKPPWSTNSMYTVVAPVILVVSYGTTRLLSNSPAHSHSRTRLITSIMIQNICTMAS